MFELVDLRGAPLAEALEVVLDARETKAAAEVQEAIAILHIVQNYHRDLPENPMPGRGRLIELAAEGGPRLNEFVPLELSAALGVSQQSITLLISDLLDLEHRHPRLWAQVRAGTVPLWHARRIVARVAAVGFGKSAALELDERLTPALPGLPLGRAMKLLEGLITAIDPRGAEDRAEAQRRSRWVRVQAQADGVSWLEGKLNGADGKHLDGALNRIAAILKENGDNDDRDARRATALGILANPLRAAALLQQQDGRGSAPPPAWLAAIDPARLLPKSVLYVHVSDDALLRGRGVARAEGIGPIPVKQLRHLLGNTRIRVQPVFDPGGVTPVDAYEIPPAMRRAVVLRHPVEVFPYGTQPSRGLDLDHTVAYRHRSGEKGQTRVENLGPLGRRAHRAKTHGGWQVEQPESGRFIWRSPLGRTYEFSPDGRTLPSARRSAGASEPPPY